MFAGELTVDAKKVIIAMERVPATFRIWQKGKRTEDIVEQPARLSNASPHSVYVGDLDDVVNIGRLQDLRIGMVVNLCPDQLAGWYAHLPKALAEAGIVHIAWPADDNPAFDIIRNVLLRGLGALIDSGLQNTSVLINCWAGMNRAPAIAIGYLVLWQQRDLLTTFEETVLQRGGVLENRSLRRLLAKECFPAHVVGLCQFPNTATSLPCLEPCEK